MQIPKINLTGDDVKRMRALLKIYSVVQFNEDITERESEVLSEYIIYGITPQAEQVITLNYGISSNNIKQINSRLQKKGLLVSRPYRQGKDLHKELELVREMYKTKNDNFLLIQLWT